MGLPAVYGTLRTASALLGKLGKRSSPGRLRPAAFLGVWFMRPAGWKIEPMMDT